MSLCVIIYIINLIDSHNDMHTHWTTIKSGNSNMRLKDMQNIFLTSYKTIHPTLIIIFPWF